MTAHALLLEAARGGLQLKAVGDMLAVAPKGACPSDLADTLRAHKRELLDYLEAPAARLTPDCAPWLHTARQVLAGEFDGADRSTAESLAIGLRSIQHPDCIHALDRLKATKP